ncbi:MAG: GNAT family N-acetyltransferase [Ottowia sp.]|uniref:GNAT family N-acetyltransferase n=1 Tax=Ottowia sp. TaxID=1898956 RepID=UPI0039E68554
MAAPPILRKAARVEGHRLLLRDAGEADAAFIHGLRTDPVRARHLSAVPPGVEAQRAWLRGYAGDAAQAYFIVADAAGGEPLGTVRLYGARGDAFSWGSWLLKAGLPPHCAIESALMVYHYGRWLGFQSAYFEVRQENASVWRFHENFGARRTGERDGHFQYTLAPQALAAALHRYRRYLPDGIRVAP